MTVTPSSETPSGESSHTSLYRQGGDLWQRARTNSLAHKLAAERQEKLNTLLVVIQAFFTAVPIVAVSISLEYVTSGHVDPSRTSALTLPFGSGYGQLSLISILASGIALFVGLVNERLRFAEKAAQHRTLQANYAVIAQKARRLEASNLDVDEGRFLLRHLQELFETYKSNPVEPSDRVFRRAQMILPKLKPIPFGLAFEPGPPSKAR